MTEYKFTDKCKTIYGTTIQLKLSGSFNGSPLDTFCHNKRNHAMYIWSNQVLKSHIAWTKSLFQRFKLPCKIVGALSG